MDTFTLQTQDKKDYLRQPTQYHNEKKEPTAPFCRRFGANPFQIAGI